MGKLKLFAFIAAAALLLLSCAETTDHPSDIAARLALLYPEDAESCSVYIDSASEIDEGYLSRQDLTYLYCSENLPESAAEALNAVDGWAILLSGGTELFELHVFRVRNRADADIVAKLLSRRVRLFRSYDFYSAVEDEDTRPNLVGGNRLFGGYSYGEHPMYGNTPFVAANSLVYVKGRYIFLLATPDNEKAIKWIEENISNSYH